MYCVSKILGFTAFRSFREGKLNADRINRGRDTETRVLQAANRFCSPRRRSLAVRSRSSQAGDDSGLADSDTAEKTLHRTAQEQHR